MNRTLHTPALAAAAVSLLGCGEPEFVGPMTLGGEAVPAETLNAGREAYMLNCYACLGDAGDGRGPSSPALRPPPRDFRSGAFKFAGVAAGELPHDEDLLRTVRRGLDGTPMLPWDIPEVQREAIVQYLKTLSPRWRDERPGERILPTEDPWKGEEEAAVARGKAVYHQMAQCGGCHPNYATKKELAETAVSLGMPAPGEFPPDEELYGSKLKESEYAVEDHKLKILPPDFLFHRVKNGTSPEELYRTIASGIGGTAMPKWRGSLPEKELWAMVHYVKALVGLRDTPEAAALRRALATQPPYQPPAPPAPAEGGSPMNASRRTGKRAPVESGE